MTSYLRGLLEMTPQPPDITAELETLQAAMLEIYFLTYKLTLAGHAKEAGVGIEIAEIIKRVYPGVHEAAMNAQPPDWLAKPRPLEIESSDDPVGDMLELQGLCRVCECPLDTDSGFCEQCADGK